MLKIQLNGNNSEGLSPYNNFVPCVPFVLLMANDNIIVLGFNIVMLPYSLVTHFLVTRWNISPMMIEVDVMFAYPPFSVTAHALWPKVCVLSCSLYTILKNLFSSPPSACLKRKLNSLLRHVCCTPPRESY